MGEITHKPDLDYIARYIGRPIAIRLVKPLSHTPITANQITILSIVLALLSAVLISFSNYKYNIIACLILEVVWILDAIDGLLARYRGEFTKFGMYLEYLFHEIVPASIFFALSINSYKYFNNIIPLYLGGLTILLIFFINVSRSSKERIVLYHIQEKKEIMDYVQHKLAGIYDKSPFGKVVVTTINLFNSPGHLFTLLLIASLFNIIQYAIFFYTIFYFIIAIVKAYFEFKQGFKPYGLK